MLLGRGEQPSDDPWQAGTLDWATPTPPPDEGYRTIPLVRSRYPLWEQPRLDGERSGAGQQHEARGSCRLAESPTGWRAQLVTSVVTAEPQAIAHLAGPSIWPLVTALLLTLNFVATLFDLYWLLVLSSIGTIAAVIAWLWPSKEEREQRLISEADRAGGAGNQRDEARRSMACPCIPRAPVLPGGGR